jgi:RNA polymerase sigma-70 factor (ECF subfamily)
LLQILDTHGADLFTLLCRLTLQPHVAEDLLQDLFLKLRDSSGFAAASNRVAYVFRSAIHLAFDWRRGRRSFETLQVDPPHDVTPPLDRMIEREDFERTLEALHQLGELSREVLILRYLHHQDYAGIAGQLGKSEHQVRALGHKGLQQLRNLLAPASDASER